jgi:hypothetical protein
MMVEGMPQERTQWGRDPHDRGNHPAIVERQKQLDPRTRQPVKIFVQMTSEVIAENEYVKRLFQLLATNVEQLTLQPLGSDTL